MTEQMTSVPVVADDDDLDAQLEAMRKAERDTGGEEPEDASGEAEDTEREARADEGETDGDKQELEPLSAEEWKQRHDNLQKALHAERSKRKENDEYRQKFAEIENRLAQLTPQQRQDAKDEAEQRPDASKDPLAALDYALNKIEQYENLENQRAQQAEQQRQQSQQINQLVQYVNNDEAEFAGKTPDYYDAVNFIRDSRRKHFEALGYNEQQAAQLAGQEAQQLAIQSVQSQRSPAETAYRYAQALGYQKAQSDAKRDDKGRYEKVKEGQKASKTLSGAGAKVKADATLETLIDSDDDPLEALHKGTDSEFDKMWSSYARQAR